MGEEREDAANNDHAYGEVLDMTQSSLQKLEQQQQLDALAERAACDAMLDVDFDVEAINAVEEAFDDYEGWAS